MPHSRWTRIRYSRTYRTFGRALSSLNWKKRQRIKRHVRMRLAEAEHAAQRVTYLQRELFRTLGNLARPAQEQIEYLQDIFRFMKMKQEDDWICADELALEYYEAFIGCCGEPDKGYPGWRHELGLTQVQVDALGALDAQLGLMSGKENSELWRGLALKESPDWRQVRAQAIECLNLLEGQQ